MTAESHAPPPLHDQVRNARRERERKLNKLQERAVRPFWIAAIVIGVSATGEVGPRIGLEGTRLSLLQGAVTVSLMLILPWLGRKLWPERFEFERQPDD